MKLRAIVTLVLALAVCTGTASAQSIGVFFDTVGMDCDDEFPGNSQFTFYLLAILGGQTANGIIASEFKLEGHSFGGAGWFGSCEANSPLTLGTPEGEGASIAFTDCMASSPVLLYTCSGFNGNATQQTVTDLRIVGHDNPSNPDITCPHQNECDQGVQVCSKTIDAKIGPGARCPLAIQEATWSSVKALFSN